MSEATQNTGDEQAVVGEPASHPHQAVVLGEAPEDDAPVLGEPVFANGLQDQQPISPPSANYTSANGVPSSHVVAPSSAPPVEESANVQHAGASESGIGEGATHQLEAPVAENPGPRVDEVSGASTDAETPVASHTHDAVHSGEEEPADDDVEITHIEDTPSEAPVPLSEVPTENPFMALATDENASGEVLADETPATDGAPAAVDTPDEISAKGLGLHQEEASLSTAVQEKPSTEHLVSDVDDGPLEGSSAVNEDVRAAELEQVGQGDALAQDSDAKEANLGEEETGSSVVEHPLTPKLDEASERDTQSEVSTIESSTPQKGILNENHAAPIASENEELLDEPVAHQGTRAIAVEECLDSQPPADETYSPPAANGNNGYQHHEDALEREQDLPKNDDDDESAEVAKPSSRIKLPLIFTGLAIAAVGVAVASISRPH